MMPETIASPAGNSNLPRWVLPIALAVVAAGAVPAAGWPAQATQPATVSEPEAPPAVIPIFEVAAIHVNKDDQSGHSHIVSSSRDGNFTAINVTLKALVQWAYVFPEARVLGGPAWFASTRFNIEAKADGAIDDQLKQLTSSEAGKAEKQRMVQALLADRFDLKAHLESRRMPVYALVVAKNGPKFKPSQVNGTTINQSGSAMRTEITVRGSDNTLALLADALARPLGRPVVDKTGLQGRFDLTLKFAPDADARAGPAGTRSSPADSGLPTVFTAIQEQLGLKLVPEKGAVPVLVVDSAEMPTEN